MEAPAIHRRLAAILAADVAGYSRMMAADEEGTLRTLGTYRSAISDLVAEHSGRIFGTAGDSVIAEFASAVQAVRSAVAIQRALQRRNADLDQTQRMEFRIGINLGDVIAQGDDLLGDGVNVAARLQEVAAPAGICISGALRDQVEGKLTFPVAHIGERMLKNIPRPVQAYRVDWRLEDASTTGVLGGALALPDKPSIAVLPFANMSGDPEQEYFADGITEDIITTLSQYRWLFVIARNSTFIYKGRAVDVKQVSRDLGVRYVLEGSVRKAGQRVRVTGQLIDAESGAHLWAERYDRDYADIFAVQDEITENVVGAIEPEILMGEGRRAARRSSASLDAFDCCMRGLWHHFQFTPEESRQAETCIRRAIELDPKLARAHMAMARVLTGRCWYGWSKDISSELSAAHAAAQHAVALDDGDAYAHYALTVTSLMFGFHQQALAAAQRAIDLNPNFAMGHFALGWVRVFIGHFAEAMDPILRCLRLNPRDPQAFLFVSQLAVAQYHLGNYDEAIHYAERALRSRRVYVVLRTLLASLGQLGRMDEARAVLAEMKRITPADPKVYWTLISPYADAAHRAHLVDGLVKAGMKVEAA
jgi:adenylate cyclase